MTSVLVVGIVAGLVASLVAGLVLPRHVFNACSCRDIFSVKPTSRQLIAVATFCSLQLLSRQPGVVATSSLHNCCHDILMLSRQPDVVATSSLSKVCCDNQVLLRAYLLWNYCRDNFLL